MIVQTRSSFDRDLARRGLTQREKRALQDFHEPLAAGPLPGEYDEHKLSDEWAGYLECHLNGDWLVIYKRFAGRVVLYRTGTHADLF